MMEVYGYGGDGWIWRMDGYGGIWRDIERYGEMGRDWIEICRYGDGERYKDI